MKASQSNDVLVSQQCGLYGQRMTCERHRSRTPHRTVSTRINAKDTNLRLPPTTYALDMSMRALGCTAAGPWLLTNFSQSLF